MQADEIRAVAIKIAVNSFNVYIGIASDPDKLKTLTHFSIPKDPFYFADRIYDYINTGKHCAELEMVEVIQRY